MALPLYDNSEKSLFSDHPTSEQTSRLSFHSSKSGLSGRAKRTILLLASAGCGLTILKFLSPSISEWVHVKGGTRDLFSGIGFSIGSPLGALVGPKSRQILPSTGAHGGITWAPCPDDKSLDCATFNVPMNYLDPDSDRTVALALRRYQAPVSPKDKKGTIFTNPGGPGGSGTASVLSSHKQFSTILGGHFDILSFDPRGVNLTQPAQNCYPSPEAAYGHFLGRVNLGLQSDAYESVFSFALEQAKGEKEAEDYAKNAALAAEMNMIERLHGQLDAQALACVENGDEEVLRSVSTAFVARDMKRIWEALGEDSFKYWGFSYGTILGATFGAMFPDLESKLVLDGVSDSIAYTRDFWDWGRAGMRDNTKVFDGFLNSCVKAGPERCALATTLPPYDPTSSAAVSTAASTLKSNLTSLSTSLSAHPLPVPSSPEGAGILTSSDLHNLIWMGLYVPKLWPDMANVMTELLNGDPKAVFAKGKIIKLDSLKTNSGNEKKSGWGWPQDAGAGEIGTRSIMCGDTDKSALKNRTLADFQDYVHELQNEAEWGGEQWSNWVEECRAWPFDGYETYRGPWTLEEGRKEAKFPILFVGNTGDPVTPLSSAKRMVEAFGKNSATLLINDGFGHCSVNHPSVCTAKAIRSYFSDGVVPEYGTTCQGDPNYLFPSPKRDDDNALTVTSEEDQELIQAMEDLGQDMVNFGPFH